VDQVKEVQRRREAGVRLDAAVSEVVTAPQVPAPSVYAELRRRHPHLLPHRLRKSTLLALSWALEDECCARAQRPWLFGAFQDERFLRQALPRWRDLARTARGAWALARSNEDVAPPAPGHPVAGDALVRVTLPDSAPMSREWALACVAPDFPAVLAAWELPGQEGTPDRDRLFESMWSLEAEAARDAGLVCARVVGDLGHDTSAALADLRSPTGARSHELRHAVGLFNRVVAYVDQLR
jgi:DICT domain-containing protein